MAFKVVARLVITPPAAIAQPHGRPAAAPRQYRRGLGAALEQLVALREPICRSCEWFQASVNRCNRPNGKDFNVCYRCTTREFPWLRLSQCPKWS